MKGGKRDGLDSTGLVVPAPGLAGEALEWAIRMDRDEAADWEAFTVWLEGDPNRARAYDQAVAALSDVESIVARTPSAARPTSAVPPGRSGPWSGGSRGRAAWLGGAVAAALLGAIGLGFGVSREPASPYLVETAPGQQREVALADGSRVLLAGATRVRLDHARPRAAILEAGQALFHVRHDARDPFHVRVSGIDLTDLGTVFDVRTTGPRTRVAVAEGAVLLQAGGTELRLEPGQSVLAERGSLHRRPVDVDDVGAWRQGRLAFDDATLAEVAEDLSRSLGTRVETTPAVASRTFRGTLDTRTLRNRPELLGTLLGVRVRRDGRHWTLEAPR